MKTGLIVFLALIQALIANAKGLPIIGQWQKEIHLDGAIYWMTLNIQETSTVVNMKCESEGELGEVSIELPSRVTQTTFEVLRAGSKSKDVGNIDCRAYFPADRMTYDTTDTQLKLVTSGNDPIFFDRLGL